MLVCCCAQTDMLKGERWVPPDLEVAHLPHMMGHPYGGIFLFSQSARMMRPVRYWAGGGGLELIGTLEQVGGLFFVGTSPNLGCVTLWQAAGTHMEAACHRSGVLCGCWRSGCTQV